MPYFIISAVFMAFVIALSIFSDLNHSKNISITGNAILDIGKLNPTFTLGMLFMISIYAVITCSYLSYRKHS